MSKASVRQETAEDKSAARARSNGKVKAATLKDIAASLGVSAMTVSNILQNNPKTKYREETIERVRQEAKRLGYQANRSAQAIRRGKTGIVGFVAKSANEHERVHDIVILPFITGLSQFLIARSKHVGMIEMQELSVAESGTMPGVLRERFFDGLVVGYGLHKELLRTIAHSGVPAIFFDCGVFERHNCIYRDERYATRAALEQLVAAGHRRIAFRWAKACWDPVGPADDKHYSFGMRERAYREFMQEHGLKPVSLKSGSIGPLGEEIRATPCTAILLDSYCPCLMGALHYLNLKVPADISLATVARETNIPIMDQSVSGMGFDRLEAGRQAAEMILKLIDTPTHSQPSIVIKSHWEEAGTVAAPRA